MTVSSFAHAFYPPPGFATLSPESSTQSRERRRVALVCKEMTSCLTAALDGKVEKLVACSEKMNAHMELVLAGLSLLLGSDWQSCVAQSAVGRKEVEIYDISSCAGDEDCKLADQEIAQLADVRCIATADAAVQTCGEWLPLPDYVTSISSVSTCSVLSESSTAVNVAASYVGDPEAAIRIVKAEDVASDHSGGGGRTRHYAVHGGPRPGIYASWHAAQPVLKGHREARCRRFECLREAEDYVKHGVVKGR